MHLTLRHPGTCWALVAMLVSTGCGQSSHSTTDNPDMGAAGMAGAAEAGHA
jgi:hypothetical protein